MIRAVFFDLDDTLCDSRTAFRRGMLSAYGLIRRRHEGFSDEILDATWKAVHGPLMEELTSGKRTMSEVRLARFRHILASLGMEDDAFADEVDLHLGATQLDCLRGFDDLQVLEELRAKGLHVGIVTNGSGDKHPDSQRSKAAALGLTTRVDSLWISDEMGYRKPDPRAFEGALRLAACVPSEALFVGDSIENDVVGANRAGMTSVLLWHGKEPIPVLADEASPDHIIRSLAEVRALVG